jgi:hypothetical protein
MGVQRRMSRAEGRIDANVGGLDMLWAAHEVDIWWWHCEIVEEGKRRDREAEASGDVRVG